MAVLKNVSREEEKKQSYESSPFSIQPVFNAGLLCRHTPRGKS